MVNRRSTLVLVAFVAIVAFLALAPAARAQFDFSTVLPGETDDLLITLSPQSPAPGQTVQLSAQSSYFDLSQSSLTWYVNGAVVSEGEGVTTAQVTAPALGAQMTVTLDAQIPDGTLASAQTTITPEALDLLVDSDSYVPPFYQGRALPSPGTTVRLQVIPHFFSGGAQIAAGNLTYTWNVGTRVAATGRGKSSITVAAPLLYDSETISVKVTSADGSLSGSASVTLPSAQPVLELYEDNPLFGIMYHQALGAQTSVQDSEMTFAAVPYFAEVSSPNDPRLKWDWSVNGAGVSPSATDPSELTIDAASSTGAASIGLEVTHKTNIFMDAKGSWQVALNSASNGSSGIFQSGATQPVLPFGQ